MRAYSVLLCLDFLGSTSKKIATRFSVILSCGSLELNLQYLRNVLATYYQSFLVLLLLLKNPLLLIGCKISAI